MADLNLAALRRIAEKHGQDRGSEGLDRWFCAGCYHMHHRCDCADQALEHLQGLLDAAEERDRLRSQRDALLTAAEAICDYDDEVEASGAQCPTAYQPLRADLLRAVGASKETP